MKKPTAAQKRRFQRVVDLNCLICDGPAEIHHCRHECGGSQRNHDHIAPLCPYHHRILGFTISRHGSPKVFADLYGTDKELHEKTCKLLGEK